MWSTTLHSLPVEHRAPENLVKHCAPRGRLSESPAWIQSEALLHSLSSNALQHPSSNTLRVVQELLFVRLTHSSLSFRGGGGKNGSVAKAHHVREFDQNAFAVHTPQGVSDTPVIKF